MQITTVKTEIGFGKTLFAPVGIETDETRWTLIVSYEVHVAAQPHEFGCRRLESCENIKLHSIRKQERIWRGKPFSNLSCDAVLTGYEAYDDIILKKHAEAVMDARWDEVLSQVEEHHKKQVTI